MRASVILLGLLMLSAAAFAPAVRGQAGSALGMGFSAGTVSPVSDGTPIYTVGDRLWVESYAGQAVIVELVSPDGRVAAESALSPTSPSPLYNFTSFDLPGSWSLETVGSEGSAPLLSVPFTFVANASVAPAPMSYQLSGDGELGASFDLRDSGAYDISACLVGSTLPTVVSIPIQSGLGDGDLLLTGNSTGVSISLQGTVTSPFTFWTELHDDYAYNSSASQAVVSKDLTVAASAPLDVSTNFTGSSAALKDDLGVRPGRLTLWAYFESSDGVSVSEAPLLVLEDGTWLWIPGCGYQGNQLNPVFSVFSPLSVSNSSWPRELYTMYLMGGVEMYSSEALSVMPSTVRVVASPWGETLTDSQLTVAAGGSVNASVVSDGTVYLLASRYPLSLQLSVMGSAELPLVVSQPFSANTFSIESGKLVVETDADASSVSGANVTVEEAGVAVATQTGVGGNATFYLLPGNYTVLGSLGTYADNATVRLAGGEFSTVSFDFPGSVILSQDQLVTYSLVFTAVLGALLGAIAWVRVYRREAGTGAA